ncbi:MAG: PEP-CTERM sorting domain-containing protein [Crocosphaera sp.]|nr:PEP-CTERM sorting domain-containing protein [Crocosphaera sp.]
MNKKILSLLGVATVAVGMTTGATSAQASTLGPGVLSVETDGGIFYSNNAVDFTIDNTAAQSPGFVGTGNVTTPINPLDSQAGIFGIVPTNSSTYPPIYPIDGLRDVDEVLAKLGDRQFVGTELRIVDFEIDPATGPASSPDPTRVINGLTYTLPQAVPFLHFDTDSDGAFSDGTYGDDFGPRIGNEVIAGDSVDTDDFTFYVTNFMRTVTPDETGLAFNSIFEFDGFFRDGSRQFKDTPAQFALFNGVTGTNPQFDPVTTNFEFENPDDDFLFQAGGDGRIGTAQAPEPGTILGLTALAGLGLSSRLKRKAK